VTAVGKVLINGAGPGGLTAAIALARQGVEVDVAEITPDRAVLGSELLLSSANLRSLRELGVVDEVVARGVPISSVQMRIADDTLVAEIPIPSVVPELPASVGILRRACMTSSTTQRSPRGQRSAMASPSSTSPWTTMAGM
jgi:2-polyprenyl-6-methoxyphenol hydroxylase-like FAD-dependent oxidoreductase